MRIGRTLAAVMRMTEETWARHASPWSVYTRIATMPVLMAALWSPHWIGWWSALPLALLAVWLVLNPRLFPPPATTDTWASKATFGERVWLNREARPIPEHHARAARLTSTLSGAGAIAMLAGAALAEPIAFLVGGAITFLAKLWFVDRMVWLYEDMKDADPVYRSWLR